MLPFWKRKQAVSGLPEISPPPPSPLDICTSAGSKPPPEVIDQIKQQALAAVQTGRAPNELYLLKYNDGRGMVSLPLSEKQGMALLLFSTPVFAREYGRVTKLNVSVVPIGTENLSTMAESFARAGATGFVLNRCPRCNVFNVAPIDTLKRPERVNLFWAIDASVKRWKMNQLAATALASLREHAFTQAIPLLENLRDHVDPGVPMVHYLLALMSKFDLLTEGALDIEASKERLKELGRSDLIEMIPEEDMRAMAEAVLTLHHAAKGIWEIKTRKTDSSAAGQANQ